MPPGTDVETVAERQRTPGDGGSIVATFSRSRRSTALNKALRARR